MANTTSAESTTATDYIYFAGTDAATANYGPWIDYEEATQFVDDHNNTDPTDPIALFGIPVEIDMNRLVPITEDMFPS